MSPAPLQVNPEGYVRAMDMESSPDANTPRPCGVALLLCMPGLLPHHLHLCHAYQ